LINKGAIDFVDSADILSVESIKSSSRCKVVMRHHNKGAHILVSQTLMQVEENYQKAYFFALEKPVLSMSLQSKRSNAMCNTSARYSMTIG